MKIFTYKYVSLGMLSLILLLAGCEDYSSVNIESESNDQVDFSTYVTIGNSLTAGIQSNALYGNAQEYSFPNLLAQQMHVVDSFEQPLISEPGLGERIQLNDSLEAAMTGDGSGRPLNANLDRPYNNLGIPGAILADFTGTDLPDAPYSARRQANPYFGVILRDLGATQAAQMTTLEPTFLTFWQGNNDVLGFVLDGGDGRQITPAATFSQLFQASMQEIAATGADAVVYNIPDVTSIPFVFLVRSQLEAQGVIEFDESSQTYKLVTDLGKFDILINVDGIPDVMRQDDFPILRAQSYFASIQAGETPPPILPQNAIPDSLVLDGNLATQDNDSELEQAGAAVAQYNAVIANTVSSSGFTLVDINAVFNEVLQNFQQSGGGITTDGITLSPIPGQGGLFSFDGVHPSNQGHAVVANITIEAINEAYGTDLQPIDVSTIPTGLPVGR